MTLLTERQMFERRLGHRARFQRLLRWHLMRIEMCVGLLRHIITDLPG